jgi:hypothetical protein
LKTLVLAPASLYKDILVLGDRANPAAGYVVQIIDQITQMAIYRAESVELMISENDRIGTLIFNGEQIKTPVWQISMNNRFAEGRQIADGLQNKSIIRG